MKKPEKCREALANGDPTRMADRGRDHARRPAAGDGFRRWLHAGLHDLPANGTILAVGCDEAFLAPHLLDYASDITVLDTSGGQMAQLARRFPEISFFTHHPAQPLPFPGQAFDAACCCEFLDRVFNPAAALREVHRVLAPGGRLLVSVPDHGGVRKVLRALFGRGEPGGAEHPRIHRFDRRTLAKLAREGGFRGIETATVAAGTRAGGAGPARRLVLTAVKGPERLRACEDRAGGAASRGWLPHEELAFAGRSRTA